MTATHSAVLSNKQSRLDPQPPATATAIIGAVQCGPEKVKKSGRRPVVLVHCPWQRLRNGSGLIDWPGSSSTSSSLGLRLFALGSTHSSSNCPSINARITRHASWVAGLTWQRSPQRTS